MPDGMVGGYRRGQGADLKYTFASVVPGFKLVSFSAEEALFTDFSIRVTLAHKTPDIDLHSLMDTEAQVGIFGEYDPTVRWLHGVVTDIARAGTGFERTMYTLTLRPAFARLRLGTDCRIWQDKAVPDIVAEILGQYGVVDTEWKLTGSYAPREYCVQYRETHAGFIERLLAEEGIYYFYEHSENGHRMVFMDASQSAPVLVAAPELSYNARTGPNTPASYISAFQQVERLRPTRLTLKDYTFLQPAYPNMQEKPQPEANGAKGDYAVYDYPGRYRDDGAAKPFTKTRAERARADATTGQGQTNNLHLSPGFSFTLADHDSAPANGSHLITSVSHSGTYSASLEEEAGSAPTTYACLFSTIPLRLPYRAPTQERPKVDGPQIAIVTGPPGEEIYCDEHGRIKVQFPWDRYAKGDETTTCWIRVAQNWAGAGWGHIAIPRIGHEVIVDFLEGDPDQPIVTGRTYHAANKPPYKLPEHKTRMTIKSDTHKGKGFNELRFEDEAGREQIYTHAQKDQDIKVLNNRTKAIDNNQIEHVGHNKKIEVKNNHDEVIGGNMTVSVGPSGVGSIVNGALGGLAGGINQIAAELGLPGGGLGEGNASIFIEKNQSETVGLVSAEQIGVGRYTTVGMTYEVTSGKTIGFTAGKRWKENIGEEKLVTVGERIIIICGDSSLEMKENGEINIKGKKIRINGKDLIKMKSAKIESN